MIWGVWLRTIQISENGNGSKDGFGKVGIMINLGRELYLQNISGKDNKGDTYTFTKL